MSIITQLAPLNGVAYTPVPSDDRPAPPDKYFDTDFTNSTFPLLWSADQGGRGDLAQLTAIGVNFLHLYDWSVPPAPWSKPGDHQRSHQTFLQECGAHGLKVFVPISNWFLGQINQHNPAIAGFIKAMVTEVYNGGTTPGPGAAIWGIANEYDLQSTFTVNDVVRAMVFLVNAEQALAIPPEHRLPVTSPVSFDDHGGQNPPAVLATQKLVDAITAEPALGSAFLAQRFVAAINTFNGGDFLSTYVNNTFPGRFPNLPFFFSEMGVPIPGPDVSDEVTQAAFVLKQLQATRPRGNFLGACVFQFLNQTAMKTGTEATFGMTKYAGNIISTGTIPPGYVPGSGQSYPVDALANKPLFNVVQSVFKP